MSGCRLTVEAWSPVVHKTWNKSIRTWLYSEDDTVPNLTQQIFIKHYNALSAELGRDPGTKSETQTSICSQCGKEDIYKWQIPIRCVKQCLVWFPRELKSRSRASCLWVEKRLVWGSLVYGPGAQRRTDEKGNALKMRGKLQKISRKCHREYQTARSFHAVFLSRPPAPPSAQLLCSIIYQSTEPSSSAFNSTFISQFQKSRRERRWLALLGSNTHVSSVNKGWGVVLWNKNFIVFIKLL